MSQTTHETHDISHVLEQRRKERDAERTPTFLEKLYLPEIFKGLLNTLKHVFRKPFTIDYIGPDTPDRDRHIASNGYRGEHYLLRHENGMEKCVACYMCATACPSQCIEIDAEEAPADEFGLARFKRPTVFNIDMLKCIYCGMCVEACPRDAIGMTNVYNQVGTKRSDFLYDKERLLRNNDEYMAKNNLTHFGQDKEGNFPFAPDGCGPHITHGMHNSRVAERYQEMAQAVYQRKKVNPLSTQAV